MSAAHPKESEHRVVEITRLVWTGRELYKKRRLDSDHLLGDLYGPAGEKFVSETGLGLHGITIKNVSGKSIRAVKWMFAVVAHYKNDKVDRDFVLDRFGAELLGLNVQSTQSDLLVGSGSCSLATTALESSVEFVTDLHGLAWISRVEFADGSYWPSVSPAIDRGDDAPKPSDGLVVRADQTVDEPTNLAILERYRSMAETKLQAIYAVAPFDPALTKLPLGYNGHSIVHVCNEIRAATPKKGEFETSQEHDARLRAVIDRYSGKEVYAFRIEGVVPVYDADRQIMMVKLFTDHLTDVRLEYSASSPSIETARVVTVSVVTLKLKVENPKSLGSYVGQNAYGATRTVTTYQSGDYNLAFCGLRYSADKGPFGINIEIPIKLDQAREMKKRLGLLVVCKPRICAVNPSGFIYNDVQFRKPTLSSPTDGIEGHTYLTIQAEVWLYDSVSGDVIRKQPIGN